ncbi:MAG: response regulator, partial [Planctomycetes bacterium]|nr:response regulator [Planctomycetota bacterium]
MKKDLLVIDDDKFVCKGISALLEGRGESPYSVNYALSGGEGIEKFKKTPSSIVLVDYLLPDIDGLTVVNELKRINQEADLIFVTGSGNMELVIKALRAGVFDYIEKPIQSEILMASLRRLETFQMLEQQRRRQEVEKEMLVFSLRHELNNFYSIISG